MNLPAITTEDLKGVFAVPPLARKADANHDLDFEQNDRIVRHIRSGGITRLIYGGNAFLYHVTLAQYEQLLAWLSDHVWKVLLMPRSCAVETRVFCREVECSYQTLSVILHGARPWHHSTGL